MKLLQQDEAPAFELVNAASENRVLLLCDHASCVVPRSLNNLGLSREQLEDHIGWDAGAADLAKALAVRLNASLIMTNYSRLVIDCNRSPTDRDSIPAQSDYVQIPGNADLDGHRRRQRQTELFQPYHRAIAHRLDAQLPGYPVLLSIHSFIPSLQGKLRPWPIGVCYGKDRRLANLLLTVLGRNLNFEIGDNKPYSVEADVDYTLPHHADRRGLLNVMLEVSRDQLQTEKGITCWSDRLAAAWEEIEPLLSRSSDENDPMVTHCSQ